MDADHNNSDHGGCPQLGLSHTIAVQGAESFSLRLVKNRGSGTVKQRCEFSRRWFRLHGFDPESGREWVSLYFGRCKKWGCPVCAEKNRQGLVARIAQGARVICKREMPGQRFGVKLWSLTLPGIWRQYVSKPEAIRRAKKALNLVMKQVRRALGPVEYVWVIEPHRTDGYPHIHMVTVGKAQSGKEVLPLMRKLWCEQQKMGNLDVQVGPRGGEISPERAGRYVAKYIAKGLLKGGKKKHVFGMSQGLTRAAKESRPVFTVLQSGIYSEDDGVLTFKVLEDHTNEGGIPFPDEDVGEEFPPGFDRREFEEWLQRVKGEQLKVF